MNNDIKVGDEVIINESCAFAGIRGMRVVVLSAEKRGLYRVEEPGGTQWTLLKTSVDPVSPARPLNDGARNESTLPNDSAGRKEYPLFDVLFGQFPAAMTAIAHHSFKGNQKHNPGQPLQDNRALSKDDANCILRHLSEGDYEGAAWRAVRLLQKKLEQEGAPVAPLATNAIGNY